MGLVRVQAARGASYTQMTEDYVAWRYNLRRAKLSAYYSIHKFKALFPQIKNVKLFLIRSKTVHGYETPEGAIFIHPDTVLKKFRNQKRILPAPL